jgi:hypothetical protein
VGLSPRLSHSPTDAGETVASRRRRGGALSAEQRLVSVGKWQTTIQELGHHSSARRARFVAPWSDFAHPNIMPNTFVDFFIFYFLFNLQNYKIISKFSKINLLPPWLMAVGHCSTAAAHGGWGTVALQPPLLGSVGFQKIVTFFLYKLGS